MCRFVKVIVKEDLKESSGVKRWLAVQSHQTFALPGEDPSIGIYCILRQVPARSPLVNIVDMKQQSFYFHACKRTMCFTVSCLYLLASNAQILDKISNYLKKLGVCGDFSPWTPSARRARLRSGSHKVRGFRPEYMS